jgi:parvulin-like peptidyl-prolyl isomerase
MKAFIIAAAIVLVTIALPVFLYLKYFSNNPVLARGKGFEIRRDKLDQVLATARAQHPQLPADADIRALTHLIEIQLVFNQATDAERAVGQKQADEQFASTSRELGDAEVKRRLEITRMTADEVRAMLGQEMTAQASLARQLQIQVTDADAKKYFDEHPGAFDEPAKAHVRELLLLTTSDFSISGAPPLPPATIQAKRVLIDQLLKHIRAGEDFAALARQYNQDPISRDSGGEMTFMKDQIEFGDLAFSMKPGQISDALTNEDGYRIFQLIECIPAKKPDFAACADRIKNSLIGAEKRRLAPNYINRLRTEAAVEIIDPQLKLALAANEAELAADARKAAEADATAKARANTTAQKEAEEKAFGWAATQPVAN